MNNVTKRSLVSMRNPSQAAELAAWLAILATGATIFLLISLHALSPEFSPSWRVISEYAFGHYAWVLSLMFLSRGIGTWALVVAIWSQVHTNSGKVGLWFLIIAGTGEAMASSYALHPPLSTRGTLHVVFGTSQLALLPFAALLINLSLVRNNEAWRPTRRLLLWTAGFPLFGFLSFAVYSAIFVFPLGPGAYGPGVNIGWPPRFAFLTSCCGS